MMRLWPLALFLVCNLVGYVAFRHHYGRGPR